jgi:hypothetical protein
MDLEQIREMTKHLPYHYYSVWTFGSHLYGLNNQNSDHDFVLIYQPNIDDLLINKSDACKKFTIRPEGKNENSSLESGDVEITCVSVIDFLRDLCYAKPYAVELASSVILDRKIMLVKGTDDAFHDIFRDAVRLITQQPFIPLDFELRKQLRFDKKIIGLSKYFQIDFHLLNRVKDIVFDIPAEMSIVEYQESLIKDATNASSDKLRIMKLLEGRKPGIINPTSLPPDVVIKLYYELERCVDSYNFALDGETICQSFQSALSNKVNSLRRE